MSPRIVSLVPSITETLHAWGCDPIACTRFCERPDLPTVGGTKNPEIDSIIAFAPDLVALDVQENRREDASALTDAGIEIVVLDVISLTGLDRELERLAAAIGLPTPPSVAPVTTPPAARRSAFVPIWRRPWMTIGRNTYGTSVLAALGIDNVLSDADADYPVITLDDVAEREPDLVIVPDEPYEFRRPHLDELTEIAPVREVDGQDLFWWGARTPAAIRRLRAAIAP